MSVANNTDVLDGAETLEALVRKVVFSIETLRLGAIVPAVNDVVNVVANVAPHRVEVVDSTLGLDKGLTDQLKALIVAHIILHGGVVSPHAL